MEAVAADLALACVAARQAGALARSRFGNHGDVHQKSPGNPVTEVDLAVDRLLRETLGAARPDYGWLSEETADDGTRLSKARTWVVDPIDGTVAFIKGKPHWSVCIGLLEGPLAVAGVVFNPVTDELFEARHGAGAVRNGAALQATRDVAIEGCRMLGARSMFEHPAWPVPWPPMEIEQRNSIALRICHVAAGDFDAAIALSSKHDWDVAAASVIAAEAGALCTTHEGEPYRFDMPEPRQKSMVVAGSGLHGLLIDRVRHVRLD